MTARRRAPRPDRPPVGPGAGSSASARAVVLAIYISEDSATVKDYRDRVGLTYPHVADPDTRIASAYRVNGIPAHYFIDASGVLRSIRTGALSTDVMDAALTEIS